MKKFYIILCIMYFKHPVNLNMLETVNFNMLERNNVTVCHTVPVIQCHRCLFKMIVHSAQVIREKPILKAVRTSW